VNARAGWRERERETERETERQSDRETERQRDRWAEEMRSIFLIRIEASDGFRCVP
jgi:hypothetical protein